MKAANAIAMAVTVAFLVLSDTATHAAYADAIRGQEWIINALDLADAHRYSEGKGVVVAVIDTGVDSSHADLSGNVLPGVDVANGTPLGNGRTDTNGHGTGMAGLIAGHGHGSDGADGVLGVAPKAKVLPVREGTSGAGGYLGV